MTDTFIFDESAYSGVKERSARRDAAKAKTTADKSAFVSSSQMSSLLAGTHTREPTVHGRGSQDRGRDGTNGGIFSDYMDISIRKNVNLSASGHD